MEQQNTEPARPAFDDLAAQQPSLLREFYEFLRQNRKWWLLPMVVILLALGGLLLLSSTVVAPFIYTLF